MYTMESVQQRGGYPGTENSVSKIEEFKLVSQSVREHFKRNGSTLQKLVRIPQMLKKKWFRRFGDLFAKFYYCF